MGRKKQFDSKKLLRINTELLARVDIWAQKQTDTPDQSEALRRLIIIGLNHE